MEGKVVSDNVVQSGEGKKTYTPALVVGILSIVFGILFALAGDILAIVGIVLSRSKKETFRTKSAFICSVIGLLISIANHVLGYMIGAGIIQL